MNSDGAKTIYLTLFLDNRLKLGNEIFLEDGEDVVSFGTEGERGSPRSVQLRCLSKQLYPNGTIIYESTRATSLRLLAEGTLAMQIQSNVTLD